MKDKKLELEIERERQVRAIERAEKTGHGRPVTRRDFLGSGLIAGAAYMTLPSILSLLSREAAASELSAECSTLLSPVAGWTPYIHVNLSGGAALHTSLLIMDSQRQLLPKYTNLGLGLTSNFTVAREFGSVPFAQIKGQYVGQVMNGLVQQSTATARAKTAMVKFAVRSQDDRYNPDNLMGLVNAVGLHGRDLPNIASSTGQKLSNTAAIIRPTPAQWVRSVDGLIASYAPQGAIKTAIADPSRREGLLKLVRNLNASQRAKVASTSSAKTFAQLVECSSSKNIDLSQSSTTEVDPRNNSAVSSIWGLTSATASTDLAACQAAVVMNALTGRAGAGKLELGGYDYHGQDRVDTDALDLKGGQLIGRVLATAEALSTPVFIHVTSDGSVEGSSESATANFGSDAGTRGSGCFLMYNPKGRPATTDSQIGQFNASQAVDETWINTWTVDRCALAVFANYLQLHSKIDLLKTITPGQFDATALAKILKVA